MPPKKQYHKNLALLLLGVRVKVRAKFKPTLRHFNLTEQQWRILRVLSEKGPLGIGAIGDACLILRPSVIGVISRMEDLDLVVRSPVATDKRRVSIDLTPHGARLVKKILPVLDTHYKDLEKTIGKTRFKELFKILEYVHDTLADEQYDLDED
jgi:homoprotocatechuate degradation regulator HpaR